MELKMSGRMLFAAWLGLTRFQPKGRASIRNHKKCWIPVSKELEALTKQAQNLRDDFPVTLILDEDSPLYLQSVLTAVGNEGIDPRLAWGYDDLMELLESVTKPVPKEAAK